MPPAIHPHSSPTCVLSWLAYGSTTAATHQALAIPSGSTPVGADVPFRGGNQGKGTTEKKEREADPVGEMEEVYRVRMNVRLKNPCAERHE